MLDRVTSIPMEGLIREVAGLKANGYRFVTLSCIALDENNGDKKNFDFIYHFDKDLGLSHLRLTVPAGAIVPSISRVYFSAFLVENEIQDLFGIPFEGLAIDYRGTLFLDKGPAPFSQDPVPSGQGQDKPGAPGTAPDSPKEG